MMNHWNIAGADALIGPLFDRFVLSVTEGLTVKLARSENGFYFIISNFFTKDPNIFITL